MARFFKTIIILSCFFLSACQEGGEAGDLLGQWRMIGTEEQYISFSGSVTWIQQLKKGEVYGNFQHVGDSLFIQCYSIEGEPIDTLIVENDFGFKPFRNVRLKIDMLSSDKLILTKEGKTWNFDKY